MRQRFGLLGAISSLALATVILTAAPAEARNVGGFGGVCTSSPGPFVQSPGSNGAGQGAYCICVVEPNSGQVLAGVTGPGSKCPPGILSLQPAPKPAG